MHIASIPFLFPVWDLLTFWFHLHEGVCMFFEINTVWLGLYWVVWQLVYYVLLTHDRYSEHSMTGMTWLVIRSPCGVLWLLYVEYFEVLLAKYTSLINILLPHVVCGLYAKVQLQWQAPSEHFGSFCEVMLCTNFGLTIIIQTFIVC